MTSLETIGERLIERYGMSDATVKNILQSKSLEKVLAVVAVDEHLLSEAALENMNKREAAVARREKEAETRMNEANLTMDEAERKFEEAENMLQKAEELNRRNKDIDAMIPELETSEARDKCRMLKLYNGNVEVSGVRDKTAYIKGCATILGGLSNELR